MDSSTQQNLIESGGQATGPVECLGLTFENDEVRRKDFFGSELTVLHNIIKIAQTLIVRRINHGVLGWRY